MGRRTGRASAVARLDPPSMEAQCRGNRADARRVYEQCRQLLAEEHGAYRRRSQTRSTVHPRHRRRRSNGASPSRRSAGTSELSRVQRRLHRRAEQVVERRSRRRRAVLLSALTGVIAAAVVVPLAVFGHGGGGGRSAVSAAGDSLGVVDRARVASCGHGVGATPTEVAAGEGANWVTNADGHTVSRIDPGTNAVVETITVGNGPSGIAIGDGAVWVVNSLDGTVSRIDPGTNTVVQTIDVGGGPRRDRLRGRLGLGREHGRRNDHEDRRRERQADQAAPGRRDRARLRRRLAVGEPACCGPGGSHRSGDREAGLARSTSGTARRGSPSATARRGWRTPGRHRLAVDPETNSSRGGHPAGTGHRMAVDPRGSG